MSPANKNLPSLGEFNAILKLYNIAADPGEKDSRLRQFKGLFYRVLDENGNKIGTPIKGSPFWHKPTLANLERKYAKNEILRFPAKKHIQVHIDWALRDGNTTLAELKDELAQQGIEMAVQRTEQGRTYGVTFVDFRSKTAFKGSDMGKQYSAKGLEQRCRYRAGAETAGHAGAGGPAAFTAKAVFAFWPSRSSGLHPAPSPPLPGFWAIPNLAWIWEELLRPIPQQQGAAYDLTYPRKRRRKKGRIGKICG